jgi:hypothetical protein
MAAITLRIAETLGHHAGQWALRHPARARRVLIALERAGFRGAGWALLALDVRERA